MPTPSKPDPLLLFRVTQLEDDHVSKAEHDLQLLGIQKSIDALKDEVETFKESVLNALKWIGGLFVTAILMGLINVAVAWFTKGF